MPDAPQQQMLGFSQSLTASGDRLFAGEPRNAHTPGRVFVYTQSDDGAWSRVSMMEANDGEVGDGFGASLAAMPSMLAVGAPSSSAVYLFMQDGDSWVQSARLAPPADSIESFGQSVALTDGTLFVSAARGSTGAVYVHEQQGDGSWMQTDVLTGSDVTSGDRFGATLAADGGHLLVGAPGKNGGTVYAFHRGTDADAWTELETLTHRQASGDSRFGSAQHLRGTSALIGAPRAFSATGAAVAYAFDAENSTWQSSGQLLPFDGSTRHLFGASFAEGESGVWIGALGASRQTGALYRFEKDAETGMWSAAARINHPDAERGDQLGRALAAVGPHIAAGLPGDDHGMGTMAVFSRDGDTWSATDLMYPEGSEALSAITGSEQPCPDEGAVEGFDCKQLDLQAFLPVRDIGGDRGVRMNDIWGWTDPETGKEYALVGRVDGTSFVDVSNPTNPIYIGDLPKHEGTRANSWRDVKVYQNHAFIVADNVGDHGMQVFDLTQLRDVSADERPVTFSETAHYDRVNSAHNVVINEDTGFAYIVGAGGGGETCGGGLHMVNIQNPTNPTFAGCFADEGTGRSGTGYTHDAQCVVYNGPDEEYKGREVCFGNNETAVSIADVSNKDNPVSIATASYPDHAYVHQGWLTEDHRYFFVNDELDEIRGLTENTRTLIWDVSDLDDPQLVDEFLLSESSTDHNLYIKDGMMYQSNYVSGLRLVDVSDPTNPKEVGYFDTVPWGDNSPGFGGTWSNYPFFESGTIVMTSGREGLFVLQKSEPGL